MECGQKMPLMLHFHHLAAMSTIRQLTNFSVFPLPSPPANVLHSVECGQKMPLMLHSFDYLPDLPAMPTIWKQVSLPAFFSVLPLVLSPVKF
jgi:hypothetical protein